MKTITKFILAILILVICILSYDFYMRNSGIRNRAEYEYQKYEIRSGEHPVEDFVERVEENRNERTDRREERRERRRAKIRKFLGN